MKENYLFQSVKGTRDFFPEETARLQQVEAAARDWFARFGCQEIRTPILEHTVLFERGVGQGTDIVNKEMFYVPGKEPDDPDAQRKMVLRPEATAAVVRAYVEHEIDKVAPGGQKYYYIGPMFRYERPQRGRLRQFTQIGVEVLGPDQPAADAETIILLHDLLSALAIAPVEFQINSVGCQQCRPAYLTALVTFARQHQAGLCRDCQTRLDRNPLRLFDCKQPGCRDIFKQAPAIQDQLCPSCQTHQAEVLRLLEGTTIPYRINPQLVRGLDYYTRTVFEVVASNLGAQNAVAAGGRYDRLVEELGGPPTPAIGWSLGVERLLECQPAASGKLPIFDAFITAPGPDPTRVFIEVMNLRRLGWRIGLEHEARSAKALMKRADRAGSRFTIFVNPDDSGRMELKNMLTGEQRATNWRELPALLSEKGDS